MLQFNCIQTMGCNIIITLWYLAMLSSAKAVSVIEGDIAVDLNLIATITGLNIAYEGRVTGHWPGGVVPYAFELGFSPVKKELIGQAMAEYRKYTCVQFVPRTTYQKNYVLFVNDGGCYSFVGQTGGRQKISIGDRCHRIGTIMHEIMHALGFYHEQSRLDRNKYIEIKWQNIKSASRSNFNRYSRGRADYWGEKYDLNSLMQYSNYAFSKNAEKTIEVKGDRYRIIGQRDGFSQSDVRQINRMYKCGEGRPTPEAVTIRTTCNDKNSSCQSMATKEQCKLNTNYMLKWCRKSCNFCSVPIICEDVDKSCSTWVKAGRCNKNPLKMVKKCTKSCNFCS